MLDFLRSDLGCLTAYVPNPGGVFSHGPTVASPTEIDHLDANECPFDLPVALKQKLATLLQQEILANRYPDGGHDRLKQALLGYVQEHDAGLTIAHLSVGNGSDELIRSLLIATCLGGEGSILVAEPTFSMYGIIAETLGVPVVRVSRRLTDFAIDGEAVHQAIQQTRHPPVRVVFVVHPNSPTANALTPLELDWLRHLPASILVVIDEAYFEFSGQTVIAEVRQHPNWVVLRTFSKAFRLAAHRVGYGVAHPEMIAVLEKVRLPYNLPSLTQAAAELALHHRQELLQAIPTLRAERDALYNFLEQQPRLRVWRSDANFLFVHLQPDNSPGLRTAVYEQLASLGTIVRHTQGGLRLTVGTPEENDRLKDRLTQVLKQL